MPSRGVVSRRNVTGSGLANCEPFARFVGLLGAGWMGSANMCMSAFFDSGHGEVESGGAAEVGLHHTTVIGNQSISGIWEAVLCHEWRLTLQVEVAVLRPKT
jgi:hypothetical protein